MGCYGVGLGIRDSHVRKSGHGAPLFLRVLAKNGRQQVLRYAQDDKNQAIALDDEIKRLLRREGLYDDVVGVAAGGEHGEEGGAAGVGLQADDGDVAGA